MIGRATLRTLRAFVLSSLASVSVCVGTLSAGDATTHWNAPASQGKTSTLDAAASPGHVENEEARSFFSSLSIENVLTPTSVNPPDDPRNLLLLQEPGPAAEPAQRPVTGQFAKKQAIQVNVITGLGNVRSDDYRSLTGKQRWQYYLNQNFISAGAFFGPILTSAIDQANAAPPEWGGGIGGYGRRLASRLGTGIVQGSAQSVGCALLGQEPRYIRSASPQVLSRIGHAFLFSLITYNNEGKIRFALPTVASYYVAGMTSNLWMPERYTALGDGVRDGNRQVILAGLVNQFQEFWPDIKRLFSRRP